MEHQKLKDKAAQLIQDAINMGYDKGLENGYHNAQEAIKIRAVIGQQADRIVELENRLRESAAAGNNNARLCEEAEAKSETYRAALERIAVLPDPPYDAESLSNEFSDVREQAKDALKQHERMNAAEQAAQQYIGKQFVDYGDNNSQVERQLSFAFKAGAEWQKAQSAVGTDRQRAALRQTPQQRLQEAKEQCAKEILCESWTNAIGKPHEYSYHESLLYDRVAQIMHGKIRTTNRKVDMKTIKFTAYFECQGIKRSQVLEIEVDDSDSEQEIEAYKEHCAIEWASAYYSISYE